MKALIIGVTLSLFSLGLFAQTNQPETKPTPLTTEHVKQFYKTTTYVVLNGNPMSDYNIKIQEVVKKYWKITPFKFVSQEEFHDKRIDPNFSFLVLSEVFFTKDDLQPKYDFLSLILGGTYQVIDEMPVLASVPIGYTEAPEESSMYKLGAIVKFIIAYVEKLKTNPELVGKNMLKQEDKEQKSIKDKTLYLVKEDMSPQLNTEAKIKAIYPDKFKFVTRDDLEDAIDKDTPGVVFLHKVGPEKTSKKARCYIMIVGTDSQLYYFDWHNVTEKNPDSMLESDFKKILKFKNK